MKAIMYHYVRPVPKDLPYFRYLHVDDFCKQLDYFEQKYGLYSLEEYITALEQKDFSSGKVLLTFDDGFKDHFKYVMPALLERKTFGVFYINTAPYTQNKALNVHKIHFLLGKYGGSAMLERLKAVLHDEMLTFSENKAFQNDTYIRQENDEDTKTFKKILNYYIAPEHQSGIVDNLMNKEDQRKFVREWYLSEQEIKIMHENKMLIGSHSDTHQVMSKLTNEMQRREVKVSFDYLESVIGSYIVKSFCYPYGGEHSFTDVTEKILHDQGCAFSFNVDPRDVMKQDFTNRPMALPRYDCNLFPHGVAMMGDRKV